MMRFVKWMMIALFGFFVMSVLRTITAEIQKGMKQGLGEEKKSAGAKASEVSPGGELKKCAACGVYNAASNSVTKVREGETVYYCSTQCRSKAASAA